MPAVLVDPSVLAIVLAGALVAGFTSGFAGFGTGLVASGLWFHALPPELVPPLVVLASVAAQLIGLITVRKAFAWSRAAPYLLGGALGVLPGVAALALASPLVLRASIGLFLVVYAASQLGQGRQRSIGAWGGRPADALVGFGGGFLGGFAGLSGPLPLIWLQLRGGAGDQQRATYQPFNLLVLMLACLGMAASGQLTADAVVVAVLCLPATVLGAWLGARSYGVVSDDLFRRLILCLLFASGCVLLLQAVGA